MNGVMRIKKKVIKNHSSQEELECQDCLLSTPHLIEYYNWYEQDVEVYICPFEKHYKSWGEKCNHNKNRLMTAEYIYD